MALWVEELCPFYSYIHHLIVCLRTWTQHCTPSSLWSLVSVLWLLPWVCLILQLYCSLPEEEESTVGSKRVHLPHRGKRGHLATSVCLQGECQHCWAAGTMQLGLLTLVVVFISSMGYSDSLKIPRGRRQRHSESSYICLTLACSFNSGLSFLFGF